MCRTNAHATAFRSCVRVNKGRLAPLRAEKKARSTRKAFAYHRECVVSWKFGSKETCCEKVSIGGGSNRGCVCLVIRPAVVGAETKKEPSFVSPKNSQFNCNGILIQDEGTYQLKPDEGMLAWCDAEIGGKDKDRVLDPCPVGDSCEIKGIIRGHGAFGWVKITSVRSLTQEKSGGRYIGLPKSRSGKKFLIG